jgi:hypothetical protein
MELLADRLDRIHLRVRVPGAPIYGELRHQREISISFGQDTYRWTNESQLQHALATLARLLSAGWAQEYNAALSDCGMEVVPPPEVRARGYEQARDKIQSMGMSADGRIAIVAIGLRDFAARIVPGTIRELSEQEFKAGVREAATAFLNNHMDQIRELQREYYK